ncbi:MAG: hypothetical protein CM15mP106_6920 [Candidatus Neomarinimicrobiota bacterium]|nr:MAG: hypothetical protein CM15mP106_6920 [Candidatus Neomarinimicrobiota bacterium]
MQILDKYLGSPFRGELVEPTLTEPTFVIDYPKGDFSTSKKMHRSGDPNLVKRFELFFGRKIFANFLN